MEKVPGKSIPVEVLFLIGEMDIEVNPDMVSQSGEYVDRYIFNWYLGFIYFPFIINITSSDSPWR